MGGSTCAPRWATPPSGLSARLAHIAGYRPQEGDRVLLSSDGETFYVVSVLHPSEPLGLVLEDGTRAVLNDGGLELRDGDDRLLVRYAEGTTQITAPRDLELAAPNGQVRVSAGSDIAFEAARDVITTAGRRVELEAAEQQRIELHPHRHPRGGLQAPRGRQGDAVATSDASILAKRSPPPPNASSLTSSATS